MNIKILLASSDSQYVQRLADIMSRTAVTTGDVIEISLFTDISKLEVYLGTKSEDEGLKKYHLAIIDESVAEALGKMDDISIIHLLTNDVVMDGIHSERWPDYTYIYKYQRVSSIVAKMFMTFSKVRGEERKGNRPVCAFFSPIGGSGSSTLAASLAMAAASEGIKPLFISLEYFNITELFFNDTNNSEQGLYDIFYVIAENGAVASAIDSAKIHDPSGIFFLKKFPIWSEVTHIEPNEIETFIDAARAAFGIDVVILDLGSTFTNFTERALHVADEIFLTSNIESTSQLKLDSFLAEGSIFKEFVGKTNLIYNKSNKIGETSPSIIAMRLATLVELNMNYHLSLQKGGSLPTDRGNFHFDLSKAYVLAESTVTATIPHLFIPMPFIGGRQGSQFEVSVTRGY